MLPLAPFRKNDRRCSMVFGYFLGISRIPAELSDFLLGLNVPRVVILIGILIMYIIAGFFIDMIAFAFLTLPVIFPAIEALGYDPDGLVHCWQVDHEINQLKCGKT